MCSLQPILEFAYVNAYPCGCVRARELNRGRDRWRKDERRAFIEISRAFLSLRTSSTLSDPRVASREKGTERKKERKKERNVVQSVKRYSPEKETFSPPSDVASLSVKRSNLLLGGREGYRVKGWGQIKRGVWEGSFGTMGKLPIRPNGNRRTVEDNMRGEKIKIKK